MSIPKDHHYLPQFYLSAWAPSGSVIEFSRPHKDVVYKSRSPKGTGYRPHLYSLPGEADPARREQVELNNMQKIDTAAALVFRRLKAKGAMGLDGPERSAWTTFLLSLIFRTPARLAWFDEQIRTFQFKFDEDERRTYERLRSADHPASPEDFFPAASDADLSVSRMALMLNLIGSQQIGAGLFEMYWCVHDLSGIGHGLLTCDEPLIMSNGMDKGSSFVLLPMGPRHLFVAGATQRAVWSFTSQKPRDLERAMNNTLVMQAERLVIGAHPGHLKFVEARLGKVALEDAGVLGRRSWVCP